MLNIRGAEAFVAVAQHGTFSGAARALGVTTSALSQAVRAFEAQLGVPLFVRTTRSVRITDAGRRLRDRLRPALDEAERALDEARSAANVVQGTLKITAGRLTVPLVIEPVLPALLRAHPQLAVEIIADDRFVDIVAEGYDAGVRLSESIAPDLVAVRLTKPFRLVVAGAPSYFARHGRPRRPKELLAHDCIGYRMPWSGSLYQWELAKRGGEQAIAVRGRVVCNDGPTMVAAALQGLGLVYIHEPAIATYLERGTLELALESHALTVPGFFLYFAPRSPRAAEDPRVPRRGARDGPAVACAAWLIS